MLMSFLFALVIFVSELAEAATHPAEQPLVQLPVVRSADSRYDQRYQLTVGPGGLWPYIGFTVQGAYFQGPDDLITFSHFRGIDVADIFRGWFSDSVATDVRLVSVGYKHFLGNSFYVEGSGFHRTLTRTYRDEDFRFSRETAGAMLVIGHQWQWPTFTLGCDWAGGLQPLANGAVKARVPGETDPEIFALDRKDFEQDSEEGRLMLLRFYLGYSF